MLIGRSVQLQVFDQQFIAKQADMRHARTAKLEAHRGAIVDRFGEPLAVSSPVDTVWVNPPEFAEAGDGIAQLARALELNRQWLGQRVTSNLDREFLYVARHLEPDEAAKIRKLAFPASISCASTSASIRTARSRDTCSASPTSTRRDSRDRVRLQPLAGRH